MRAPGMDDRRVDAEPEHDQFGRAETEAELGRVERDPVRRVPLRYPADDHGGRPDQHRHRETPEQHRAEGDRPGGRQRVGAAAPRGGDPPDLAGQDHAGHNPEHRQGQVMATHPAQVHKGKDKYSAAGDRYPGHINPQRRAETRTNVPRVVRVFHGVLTSRRSNRGEPVRDSLPIRLPRELHLTQPNAYYLLLAALS